MQIELRRVYEPHAEDGRRRILVERLWPRGVSREAARIDLWARDVAPSTELRKWYGHDPEKWPELKRRYFAELDARPEAVAALVEAIGDRPVSFVFAARDWRNSAVALKEYLQAGKFIAPEGAPD